jgi:replication factor C subunit 2/4
MENSIPWIEKYRPSCLDEIILDPYTKNQIKVFLQNKEGVHLIITGSPGVGKTSTVRCIARELLGENLNQGYLELNSADDRGVKSISLTVPSFCKRVVNFDCSKVILLDEADNMTNKCQYDINEMIKQYGKKVKFIFTCNDSKKIIPDIQSVCHILRFKHLTQSQITTYLEKICQKENIPFDKTGMDTICYICAGDMRKAINNLQLTAFSYQNIVKDNVLKICKMPDPEDIKLIIAMCCKKDLNSAISELQIVLSRGYCYLDVVNSFIYILGSYDFSMEVRLKLINIVNHTKINISTGLRSELQLFSMICSIIHEFE